MLIKLLIVGCGGFLGAIARYAIALALTTDRSRFPWATLVANVIGCLLIGVLMWFVAGRERGMPEDWRLFLAVGLLGSLTTFSTFAYEALELFGHRDEPAKAGAYVALSVVLGLGAAWIGWAGARMIAG